MKKICIIGNSHVAALKRAWDLRPRSIDVDFFAAPRDNFKNLLVSNSELVPTTDRLKRYIYHTSGGKEVIKLREYRKIFIVGCQLSVTRIGEIYREYRFSEMKGYELCRHKISREAFYEFSESTIENGLSINLAEKIKKASNTNIYLVTQPLPSEALRDSDKPDVLRPAIRHEDYIIIDDIFSSCVDKLKARFTIIHQPDNTITADRFTYSAFSKDSVSMVDDQEHAKDDYYRMNAKDDYYHMNAEYGDLILNTMLDDG